jgi:hypothetical protein
MAFSFASWKLPLLLLLPAAGLFELVAHLRQVRPRTDAVDYRAVSTALSPELKETDLVVFSPEWTDPLGRQALGTVLGPSRTAYVDASRYARIFEVSQGGERRPEFQNLPVQSARVFGGLTVLEHRNANAVLVHDDLMKHIPKEVHAWAGRAPLAGIANLGSVVGNGTSGAGTAQSECPWTVGAAQAGPWDVARPSGTYACRSAGVWAAPIVMLDGKYQARHCLFVSAPEMTLQFENTHFAKELVLHMGFHRARDQGHGQGQGAAQGDLSLSVKAELSDGSIVLREVGRAEHHEGQTWSEAHLATPALTGQTGDLYVEVRGNGHLCFEVTSR